MRPGGYPPKRRSDSKNKPNQSINQLMERKCIERRKWSPCVRPLARAFPDESSRQLLSSAPRRIRGLIQTSITHEVATGLCCVWGKSWWVGRSFKLILKKNPPLAPTAQLQWCFLVKSSKRIVIRKNQKVDLCFANDMIITHHSYNSYGSTSTAAHTASMIRAYIMGISDAEELPTDTDRGRSRSQALFRLH